MVLCQNLKQANKFLVFKLSRKSKENCYSEKMNVTTRLTDECVWIEITSQHRDYAAIQKIVYYLKRILTNEHFDQSNLGMTKYFIISHFFYCLYEPLCHCKNDDIFYNHQLILSKTVQLYNFARLLLIANACLNSNEVFINITTSC